MLRGETELEITARRHGPATSLLARHNLRVPLELPVLGFGGDESFRIPIASEGGGREGKLAVFVAGGVGVTPLLAQAPGLLAGVGEGDEPGLRVLWSLRAADLPLAVHTVEKVGGLGRCVKLFVTGEVGEKEQHLIGKLQSLGAQAVMRRMEKKDGLDIESYETAQGRKYYLCASPPMLKLLSEWLEEEETVAESFNY